MIGLSKYVIIDGNKKAGYPGRRFHSAFAATPLLISVSRTVDAILTVGVTVCNQAIQNGRCHIYFSLCLDKVETGYNLLMEYNALAKCLIVHTHTGLLAVSF